MADEAPTSDHTSDLTGDASDTESAASTSKKGYTPPKGRPTRGRNEAPNDRRAFGPVAQWITFAIAVLVIIVVIIMVTGGGDFNPFNDDDLNIDTSAPVVDDAVI